MKSPSYLSHFRPTLITLLGVCLTGSSFGQTVDGTDLADTISIGGSAISSDNTLTYDLGDGGGSQTGTTTPDYSQFNSTPIVLDAKDGDDNISVSGTPTVSINVFGGLGTNTIKVPAGFYLMGDIQAGSVLPISSDNSSIEIYGHVLGDVGYGDVLIFGTEGDAASLSGSIGTIDGEERLAHNVTLSNAIVANAGGGTAIKANGRIIINNSVINGEVDNRFSVDEDGVDMEDASSATLYSNGPIFIKNGGPGVIDNSTSTTQASVTVIQGGSGNITSRGEIIVYQGGGSAFTNTQLVPDTDNPGVLISLAGGGNVTSDGEVIIETGGIGAINAPKVVLGGGASGADITGRNLAVLDFVDSVTVKAGGSVNSASLGLGNDTFKIEQFTDVSAGETIDGGEGEADMFMLEGILITDFAVIYNYAEVGLYSQSGNITSAIDSTNFEEYIVTDESVSEADAAIYGAELVRIFYDTEFSGPLANLLSYVNGVLYSETELEDYELPSDSDIQTQFTFTGNNPISGEFLTFEFTSSVPEPQTYAMILGLVCISVLMVRRKKQ
ncbi:hypothetical protein [Cerasicoccus arenae]|uniref:PEP-CTERM protein-sorting domain-containing protein n=1 Tax=Cerasicoccus arenae TaxID=424488 RepID=A0A8J3DBQ3_9BACT|nr:hypothetical protein [Cerasicoccus arenae]MBK1857212.1 hypothetical protein [Cerasicoccus arenae]GHC00031.1 hypothetical protein GCM10007047_15320 [Cerasicoccus arenae]